MTRQGGIEHKIRPLFPLRPRAPQGIPILEGAPHPRRLFDALPAPSLSGPLLAEQAVTFPPPAAASEPTAVEPSPDAPPPPAPPEPSAELLAELASARAEAEAARDRYLRALQEVMRVHDLEFRALESDLVDLAIEIARTILMRELSTDRLYVVRLVEAALSVAVEEDVATVLVAPADLALVEQERTRLEVRHGGGLIRVTADPALHPGDCVVQVGRARIDGRLNDRLERVRQALHGVVTETE
ncbi:MAG: FliH/SctL family protein [Myxococcales bacterium]|nr:flagellar assembly protein FliH [Myxococcota bacterium]MDW8282821.1 FliH/SctL family protein [Myxococcales bacterium]